MHTPVLYIPLRNCAEKMEKMCKITRKIAIEIDGRIALKLAKFAPELHTRCMVVVNKHKKILMKLNLGSIFT